MNILIVTPKISRKGGIERYTTEIANGMINKGHNIYLLTSEMDVDIPEAKILKINLPQKPEWLKVLIFALKSYTQIKKIKKQFPIDLVVSNGSATFLADVVIAHSVHIDSIIKTNKINSTESKSLMVFLRGLFRYVWPKNLAINFVELIAYKKAKNIIAVSSEIKKDLQKSFNIRSSKITVVPNGVDIEKFHPNTLYREEVRKKYNVNENIFLILFVGHEFKRKGLEYVIRALPLVSNNITLIIAGNDSLYPYNELIEKLNIKEKIVFLGPVESNIEKLFASADLFILPTQYEPFGLVYIEAMSSGVPVLATKTEGPVEFVKNGYNGYFINRDEKDIADKIKLVMEDKMSNKMKQNARETAIQYTWENTIEKTLEVFKKQ